MKKGLKLSGLALICLLGAPLVALAQFTFDKPKNTKPLPMPYTISASRNQIIGAARQVLGECKIPFEAKTEGGRHVEDSLVTKPLVFTSAVNSRTDLEHYSTPPAEEVHAWTAGRAWVEIIALPLAAKRSQIQIVAHIQGRIGGVAGEAERWVDCSSNGLLEDEVLRGIAGKILGIDLSIDQNGSRRFLRCEY